MITVSDYNIVLHRQNDGWWVASAPAIAGCHALMPTREQALDELQLVFEMIVEEYQENGQSLPPNREKICA